MKLRLIRGISEGFFLLLKHSVKIFQVIEKIFEIWTLLLYVTRRLFQISFYCMVRRFKHSLQIIGVYCEVCAKILTLFSLITCYKESWWRNKEFCCIFIYFQSNSSSRRTLFGLQCWYFSFAKLFTIEDAG